MEEKEETPKTPEISEWRVVFSIITGVGWLIFLIIWLFFYAVDFNIYQNIAIFLISLLAIGGLNAAVWAPWGMRQDKKYKK